MGNGAARARGHAPDLGEHRLLANGASAALLRRDGELDWWCFPEIDSPPLLWRLLDPDGPSARWRGVRVHEVSGPPAGPVPSTSLRLDRTRLETRDGLLAAAGGPPSLVRAVRALDTDLDVCHELKAGVLGQPAALWRGATAQLPDLALRAFGGESAARGDCLVTRLVAARREWAVLVVGVAPAPSYDTARLLSELDELGAHAEEQAGADRLPRHHPRRAADALRVLVALTYPPTGAVVAAPTTSLPEAPGADRQFDYRYTWLRDASLAVSVASLLGRRDAAMGYLDFVCGHLDNADPLATAPVLDVRGQPVPPERAVEGVAGWAGSRPVRIGNAAGGQCQPGALGLVVEAVSVHVQTGGALDASIWQAVRAIADAVAQDVLAHPDLPAPTAGIWELRAPERLVEEDIGRWIALDRALWIACGWRPLAGRRHWRAARAVVRDRVIDALDDNGGLPQAYDGNPARRDAAALMAVVFGLFAPNDPRGARLVDVTLAALSTGPLLHRYPPGDHDGFAGQEGAFVPVSWWAVSALAATGRYAEAVARADGLDAVLPALMAEEMDPVDLRALGNIPLLWSHMEAARALYHLDIARLRRRYGALGVMVWRVVRYLRLRFGSPNVS